MPIPQAGPRGWGGRKGKGEANQLCHPWLTAHPSRANKGPGPSVLCSGPTRLQEYRSLLRNSSQGPTCPHSRPPDIHTHVECEHRRLLVCSSLQRPLQAFLKLTVGVPLTRGPHKLQHTPTGRTVSFTVLKIPLFPAPAFVRFSIIASSSPRPAPPFLGSSGLSRHPALPTYSPRPCKSASLAPCVCHLPRGPTEWAMPYLQLLAPPAPLAALIPV